MLTTIFITTVNCHFKKKFSISINKAGFLIIQKCISQGQEKLGKNQKIFKMKFCGYPIQIRQQNKTKILIILQR